MPNLVGIGLSQVPTNSMLGGLAYQDPEHASIKNLDLKNLSQINSEIADTAVDVFIYDTSKDSDGGAWRKRTQNTSWYNETLGTTTRGTRKEFPAVAVIVAESLKVTIYDGDDPDLPMWMVFHSDGGNCMIRNSGVIASVTMLNAELCVGRTSGSKGLGQISFITEVGKTIRRSSSGYLYIYKGNIEQRNDSLEYANQNDATQAIKGDLVYDVAMTVLPNAPVDSATGLPIPTIAVATDQGISVLKDNGSIVDWIETSGPNSTHKVSFRNNGKLGVFTSGTSGIAGYPQLYYIDIPSSDVSASFYYNFTSLNFERYGGTAWESNSAANLLMNNGSSGPASATLTDMVDTPNLTYAATGDGLNAIIRPEVFADMRTAAVAYIQKDYNTGYMVGDIKGALLSDTDTTNATGSEKIANYNFAADFSTQWEVKNNANTSYDATNDRVTVTSTQNYSGIRLKSASLPTLTQGKRYIMTVEVHSITNPIRFGVVSGGTKDSVNSTGAHTLTFTAQASVTEVFVEKPTGSNSTFVLNSVSIREAEEDRSVNNNSLQVFGTITKTPVATGAELVAYSGFSAANYLFQPYNSDLNFTNTMMIMLWVKGWQSGDDLLHRGPNQTRNSQTSYSLYCDAGHDYRLILTSNGTSEQSFEILLDANQTGWQHLCFTLSGGTVRGFLNGEEKVLDNSTFTGTLYSGAPGLHGLWIGRGPVSGYPDTASLALLRLSASVPSPEQVKKMYEDEKCLFHENAKATLYGSSDAVTALAYDDTTELLHVGTSAGRSEFQGLRRINNTTVGITSAISASNDLVAEQ